MPSEVRVQLCFQVKALLDPLSTEVRWHARGRHHADERWILGTRWRLFAVRLADHRSGVGLGREPPLDPKFSHTCRVVTLAAPGVPAELLSATLPSLRRRSRSRRSLLYPSASAVHSRLR